MKVNSKSEDNNFDFALTGIEPHRQIYFEFEISTYFVLETALDSKILSTKILLVTEAVTQELGDCNQTGLYCFKNELRIKYGLDY